ncbi:MAG TPA: hypothetical protein VD834_16605 [Blastococcus sp.]|nr:hypothetical protein [Nocardioides sp.]HYH26968.1 hypothetical protein [Blastococcus sp.]
MATIDSAVLIPGTGHLYIAPAETAIPAALTAPAAPWEDLGHTSREDGLTITRDGGDSETVGTWQNPTLRERREPTTFAITAYLHQVTNDVLEMFFGPGDATVADQFGVTSSTATIERALYARIVDGTNEVGLYVPKVSISSEDDVEIDVENFLSFPVRMTVLQVTGSNLMTWIGPELGISA